MHNNETDIPFFFPYEGFIAYLQENGYTIGVHTFMRVQELLCHIAPHTAASELKGVLTPIFATNVDEQNRFGYLFDTYFGQFEVLNPSDFPIKEAQPLPSSSTASSSTIRRPRLWLAQIASMTTILILGSIFGILWYGFRNYQESSDYYAAYEIEATTIQKHVYSLYKIANKFGARLPQPCDSLSADFSYTISNLGNNTYGLELTGKDVRSVSECYWIINDELSPKGLTYYKSGLLAGDYSITMLIVSKDNCKKRLKFSVPIGQVNPSQPGLLADFTYTFTGYSFAFKDTSSTTEKNILTREWDFGDGKKSQLKNPTHLYEQDGNYAVCLKVFDGKSSHSVCKDIYVRAKLPVNQIPLTIPTLLPLSIYEFPRKITAFTGTDSQYAPYVFLIFAIVVIPFYVIKYRNKKRNYLIQKEHGEAPLPFYQISINTPFQLYEPSIWLRTANSLRKREVGTNNIIDVPATLQATIASGGMQKIQYKYERRPVEYLFLIDAHSFKDHQALYFKSLAERFAREDIYIDVYFYQHNFQYFWRDFDERPIYLEELVSIHPNHRLVIIGAGDGLLEPYSNEFLETIEPLTQYRYRALMSTNSTSDWGLKEVTLESKFLVLPAKILGFAAVGERWERSMSFQLKDWIDGTDNPLPDMNPQPSIADLQGYLGYDTFRWLAACAIYPEINWDMTLYLGKFLSETFHPSDTLPNENKFFLLREDNMLRLFRLSFFRKGEIPEKLRWELVQTLSPPIQQKIREAIVKGLEENMPSNTQLGTDKNKINIAIQKWQINPKDAKIREQVQTYLEQNEVQDYVAIESLKSDFITHVSPNAKLSERLRRFVYRNGIPLLGLNSYIIAGISILLFLVASYTLIRYLPEKKKVLRDKNGVFYYLQTHADTIAYLNYQGGANYTDQFFGNAYNQWTQAIASSPFNPYLYYNRGLSNYRLYKSANTAQDSSFIQNAIEDFEIANLLFPSDKYTGTPQVELLKNNPKRWGAQVSPLGDYLLSADETRLFLYKTAEKTQAILPFNTKIKSFVISPNGSEIWVGTEDFHIHRIHAQTLKESDIWTSKNEHKGAVTALAISPNGRYLASGGTDKIINIWDIQTQSVIQKIEKHSDRITLLAFANDSRRLLSASSDQSAYIWTWESQSYRPLQLLGEQDAPIVYGGFTPNGNLSILVLANGKVNIWGKEKLFYTFKVAEDVLSATLNKDGSTIILGLKNGHIRIVPLIYSETQPQIASYNLHEIYNQAQSTHISSDNFIINGVGVAAVHEKLWLTTSLGEIYLSFKKNTPTSPSKPIITRKKSTLYKGWILNTPEKMRDKTILFKESILPYHLAICYLEQSDFQHAFEVMKNHTPNLQVPQDTIGRMIAGAKALTEILYAHQTQNKTILNEGLSHVEAVAAYLRVGEKGASNNQYDWMQLLDEIETRFGITSLSDNPLYLRICALQNKVYPDYCTIKQKYQMLGKPSEGFIAFKEKDLWGYLDKNKSYAVAIPPIFTEANPFKNGLAMVASPRKAGLEYFIINKQGAVAYKHTGILRERMLPVSNLEGKWGYMDENFTLVIPPQYGYAGAFIHGFAAITEGEFFRFIDKNGKFLNDFLYDEVNAFGDNGLALVKREGSTRYLGKDGQEREISPGGGNATKPVDEAPVMRIAELSRDVVEQQSKAVAVKKDNNPEKYDFVGELIEGLRLVKMKGKVGFVNAEGKPVINTIYENAADFSEGKAAVQLQGKWGFINNYGIIKIPPQYDGVKIPFKNGKALVSKGDNQYYINDQNDCVDDAKFKCPPNISVSKEDKALIPYVEMDMQVIQKDGKFGIQDAKGEVIIAPIYENRIVFRGGAAKVFKDGKWGFINTKGKIIAEIKYDQAGEFVNGLAPVKIGKKWGYVDLSGKLVIPAIYDEAENFTQRKALVKTAKDSYYINPNGGFEPSSPKDKKATIKQKIENLKR